MNNKCLRMVEAMTLEAKVAGLKSRKEYLSEAIEFLVEVDEFEACERLEQEKSIVVAEYKSHKMALKELKDNMEREAMDKVRKMTGEDFENIEEFMDALIEKIVRR